MAQNPWEATMHFQFGGHPSRTSGIFPGSTRPTRLMQKWGLESPTRDTCNTGSSCHGKLLFLSEEFSPAFPRRKPSLSPRDPLCLDPFDKGRNQLPVPTSRCPGYLPKHETPNGGKEVRGAFRIRLHQPNRKKTSRLAVLCHYYFDLLNAAMSFRTRSL